LILPCTSTMGRIGNGNLHQVSYNITTHLTCTHVSHSITNIYIVPVPSIMQVLLNVIPVPFFHTLLLFIIFIDYYSSSYLHPVPCTVATHHTNVQHHTRFLSVPAPRIILWLCITPVPLILHHYYTSYLHPVPYTGTIRHTRTQHHTQSLYVIPATRSIHYCYGVATISRLPKNIGLFCKRALYKDDIVQKRPVVLRSLLIINTPYASYQCPLSTLVRWGGYD